MASPLQPLDGARLDVLVLGGGISGAATARELALSGYDVALVEPHDFGWGTSGRSSRLIHGGLRYLAGGHLRMIRRSLVARRELVTAAPHLVRPCPFVVPFGDGDPRGWRLTARAGVMAYDLLSRPRHGWPAPRTIGREQARVLIPGLDPAGFERGLLYHDGWTDDCRLTLVTALDARRSGARLATRCELVALRAEASGVARATVRDRITGELAAIETRSIVNATGAWVDRVREQLGVDGCRDRLALVRPTRGTHVVVAGRIDAAALLRHPGDGRVVFLIPTCDGFLAGTTDEDDTRPPDDVSSTADDVRYLMRLVAHALPHSEIRVRAAFAGLRPLVRAAGDPDRISRRSRNVEETAEGIPLVSIVGGKLTLHRSMASATARVVARAIGAPRRSPREPESRLPGGEIASFPGEQAAARAAGLTSLQARWMVGRYGSNWREVIESGAGASPLGRGEIPLAAEVEWSLREEALRTASDLLLRWRLPEVVDDESGIAEDVVAMLGELGGWNVSRRERELERWRKDRSRLYGAAQPVAITTR
jgi:glycerol-3-phosphate dehydrogenase